MGVDARGHSYNSYDLVPVGDRITYTIDISTPEGKQKLYKLSLDEAQRLAETEACRKYNCDRLIDPRFDYLKKVVPAITEHVKISLTHAPGRK